MMQTALDDSIRLQLTSLRTELQQELKDILQWWILYMPDRTNGGFWGSVDDANTPAAEAEKGIVLNSRILWAFSAAAHFTGDIKYINIAHKAFAYIEQHFRDTEYGGVYWSVDYKGNPLQDRKQIYGLAFCIYGLSEYYRVTREERVLDFAKDLYALIEKYSYDERRGGYVEAFARDWSELEDLRLSEKDDNQRKTMNTHLHIVEAYANLYEVWPSATLKEKVRSLLLLFDQHFIDHKSGHLHLFMDDDWKVQSTLQSFGHDIEAAWLLPACAGSIGDSQLAERYHALTLQITEAAMEGLDPADGGMLYEYEPATGHLIRQKHSWPQAEAMIGFIHAYKVSGDDKYLVQMLSSFSYIKSMIKNREQGEWYWGREADATTMAKEKAGFWKCPYHNSRACMEVIKRIDHLLSHH